MGDRFYLGQLAALGNCPGLPYHNVEGNEKWHGMTKRKQQ